ncbi:MAG: GNAT family N-acetyltransferase [Saprospiraceae bacterium]|nr:GNAT family N-acetyltransferase [Saprospiraceae bacterium]
MNINIEFAGIEDSQSLFLLVNELALYEKAENEVFTDASDFRNGLETELFKVLIAKIEGQIVGMALYYPVFSTWNGKTMYLEDFIVKEVHRGKGIGKLLFDRWIEESIKEGAKMLKWQVLDWNKPAKKFYEKYSAKFIPGWENGVIYLYERSK